MRRQSSVIAAGVIGALFALGLLISGMTDPAKVIGFLTLGSNWDPTLAFVMAGATTVYALAYRAIRRRSRPLAELTFHLPTRRDLDLPLLLGAAIFGVGWGMGGFCPGPAVVSAGAGSVTGIAFVAAMLTGMYAKHKT